MKLSEYIKSLQDILDSCGDLPCIYSSDDEGNEYRDVWEPPTMQHVMVYDNGFDLIHPDDIRDYRDWETDRKSTRLNSSHRL